MKTWLALFVMVSLTACNVEFPPPKIPVPMSPSYDLETNDLGQTTAINVRFFWNINQRVAPALTGLNVYYYGIRATPDDPWTQTPQACDPGINTRVKSNEAVGPSESNSQQAIDAYCERFAARIDAAGLTTYERAEASMNDIWCRHLSGRLNPVEFDRQINQEVQFGMIHGSRGLTVLPTVPNDDIARLWGDELGGERQGDATGNNVVLMEFPVPPGLQDGVQGPGVSVFQDGVVTADNTSEQCYYFALSAFDPIARVESILSETVMACSSTYVEDGTRMPAPGATGVAVDSDLVFELNRPPDQNASTISVINLSNVTAPGYTEQDDGSVIIDLGLAAGVTVNDRTVTLDPAADFLPGETVSINLGGIVDSVCGEPVANRTWTFTTQGN